MLGTQDRLREKVHQAAERHDPRARRRAWVFWTWAWSWHLPHSGLRLDLGYFSRISRRRAAPHKPPRHDLSSAHACRFDESCYALMALCNPKMLRLLVVAPCLIRSMAAAMAPTKKISGHRHHARVANELERRSAGSAGGAPPAPDLLKRALALYPPKKFPGNNAGQVGYKGPRYQFEPPFFAHVTPTPTPSPPCRVAWSTYVTPQRRFVLTQALLAVLCPNWGPIHP